MDKIETAFNVCMQWLYLIGQANVWAYNAHSYEQLKTDVSAGAFLVTCTEIKKKTPLMLRNEHNENTWNNCGLDVLNVMLWHTGDELV